MKQNIIAFLMFSLVAIPYAKAQKIVVNRQVESSQHGTLLLGHQTVEQFEQEPFSNWFSEIYNEYQPNTEVLQQLRKKKIVSTRILIFMATWSEQSQSEFPKLMKILDMLKYPKNKLQIIALNSKNESPTGEEALYNIQDNPTIIIKKYGKQLGRVVSAPASGSWEQNLLEILSK